MAKKETSAESSGAASRLLEFSKTGRFYWRGDDQKARDVTGLVKRVAASALVQDETKGQAKKPRRKK